MKPSTDIRNENQGEPMGTVFGAGQVRINVLPEITKELTTLPGSGDLNVFPARKPPFPEQW